MRAVIQRVSEATILIDGTQRREIRQGLVVFLGVMAGDTPAQADYLCGKICDLRIFTDENDKMNHALKDIDGDLLVVSNFTLSADCKHGRRPSFERAAKQDTAKELYDYFVSRVRSQGLHRVETGEFGAHMHITAGNDGPVTIMLDTDNIAKH